MFGNKDKKLQRLLEIEQRVRQADGQLSQADLAREMNVSRGTICKDLAILQAQAGILLAEDNNGRLSWVGREKWAKLP